MSKEINNRLIASLRRLGDMLVTMEDFRSATCASPALSNSAKELFDLVDEIESGKTKLIITKYRARSMSQYLLNLALDFDQLHDIVQDKGYPKRAKK